MRWKNVIDWRAALELVFSGFLWAVGMFLAAMLFSFVHGLIFPKEAKAAGPIPAAMLRYRSEIIRASRVEAGLDARVATFAGQVEQESGGNTEARSPVGASGLAQFMPATARDLGRSRPDLGPAVPTNPGWALRAMVAYDQAQLRRITANTECDAWLMALAAYNGGLGWVWRDQTKAKAQGLDPGSWAVVAKVNAGRAAAAKDENARYGPAIVYRRQPKFLTWGPGVMCEVPQ